MYFLHGFLFLRHCLLLILGATVSPLEISTMVSMFSVVTLLAEIPLGVISGHLGPKKMLLLGLLAYTFGYLIILARKNFITFCIFYGSSGFYETIFSSSREVIAYSSAKHLGIEDGLVRYRSNAKMLQYGALVLSSFLAGKLVGQDIGYLIVVDISTLLLHLITVCSLAEYNNQNLKKLNANYLQSVKKSLRYLLRHYSLRKLIIFRVVWSSMLKVFASYAPIFYEKITGGTARIKYMIPGQILMSAVLQRITMKYLLEKKNIYLDTLLFFFAGLTALCAVAIHRGILSYGLLIAYFACLQNAELLFFSRIQRLIPAKFQAIIVSTSSFANSLGRIVLLRTIGLLANGHGYHLAFGVPAAFLTFSTLLFSLTILGDKHINLLERRNKPNSRDSREAQRL
ncbi:MAG: MFS transporter [Rickettsiales bacterium]|nr:MFS transporter [Rickettsiales bacterium]